MADVQVIRCPSCGAMNRVPLDKVAQGLEPVCGRCQKPLPAKVKPMTVTDATFAADVERSPDPVLVDMWAPWCRPCRAMTSVVEEVAKELAGRVRVATMNVDDNPNTASRYRVMSIPTLLVFKHGKEVERIVGLAPKEQILQRVGRVAA